MLRRRGANRRPNAAARRSAAAAAHAPTTLSPFRFGGAVPTVVPVPRRVDLPLPLRTFPSAMTAVSVIGFVGLVVVCVAPGEGYSTASIFDL